MSNSPKNEAREAQPGREREGEKLVYVMPEYAFRGPGTDEVNLRELLSILWRGKWTIVTVTAIFAVGSVLFALNSEEWYRSETVLAPADQGSSSSMGSQLGGLAALAGVSLGSSGSSQAIATLKSREMARAFIEDHGLVEVFFSDAWDENRNAWIGDDPKYWPDARDAVQYFHRNVFSLKQDLETGLVTLAIEWKDPEVAANWATDLVRRVNDTQRQRALEEAETNIAYLNAEFSKTTLITLQQSIGRLLESELQKLMLAKGQDEFAFTVIDEARPPRERVRPNRALISVAGTIVGGVLAVLLVLLRHGFSSQRQSEAPA